MYFILNRCIYCLIFLSINRDRGNQSATANQNLDRGWQRNSIADVALLGL